MDTDGKGSNALPIAYLVCRLLIYRQIVDAKAFRTDLRKDGSPNRHLTRSVFIKACTLTRSPTLIVSRSSLGKATHSGFPLTPISWSFRLGPSRLPRGFDPLGIRDNFF